MVPVSRRSVLASIGATSLTIAGCLEPSDEASSPTARTSTKPPESSDTVPSDVTLTNPDVLRMLIADLGIWGDLRHWPGQFLVVDVNGPDGASIMDAYDFSYELPLQLELEGRRVDEDAFLAALVESGRPPVDPESLDTHVAAIPVQFTDAERATVVWDGPANDTTLELGDAVLNQLSTGPQFEIRRFETPIMADGSIALDLGIENVGDRAGQWLGQVSIGGAEDISDVFGFTVPAGSRIERTVRPPILSGTSIQGTVTVQFWSSETFEREVTLPATGTPG